MTKHFNKALIGLSLIMLALFVVGCDKKETPKTAFDSDLTKMNYEVSKDQYFDQSGNLLVTYDVAYKSLFESGEVKYSEEAILVKLASSFDGVITKNMKNAGLSSLSFISSNGKTSWYKATLKPNQAVISVMSALRVLDEVLIADFDYIYETKEISFPEVIENEKIQEQWSLDAYGIEDSWTWLNSKGHSSGGSSSVVVAVIDTGVDYTHKDLKNNMWVNTREIPNNGIDDDGNGYIDDVYGIDTIAHTSNPMDDHGHGTHVAGIIAAENNKEGIVGIAYKTKIMAVKAGMSSGFFTQSSIAEAIYYAYENGADVINMSFGGSAVSIAVQDALMTAYTRSILVASAGNDGLPNEAIEGWYGRVVPNYPAALSYVVGVMSVDKNGVESAFSNWDSKGFNSVEYEVYAPGEGIISTLPNNQYASWSGTSMAAPFVSGIAALLRSIYPDRDVYTNKFIMGQLVATSTQKATASPFLPPHNVPVIIDSYKALTVLPKPDVNLFDHYLFDTVGLSPANNGNGFIDAGETIDIGFVLRNRWGMSNDMVVSIDSISSGGVENPYVEFITNEVDFGSVGTYSTKDNLLKEQSIVKGVANPLRIKILESTPNDYIINLNIKGTYKNALDLEDTKTYVFEDTILIKVRKGQILPNIISEDLTLTKENYYIIPNSMVVLSGTTLTVEEGTQIQFWGNDPQDAYAQTSIAYLKVEGKLLVKGTLEEPVKLFPSELMDRYRVEIYETGNGYVSLEYAEVTNGHLNISYANRSTFKQNFLGTLYNRYLESGAVKSNYYNPAQLYIANSENSIFYGLGATDNEYYYKPYLIGSFFNNIFVNSSVQLSGVFEDNVFLGNNSTIYGSSQASSLQMGMLNHISIQNVIYNHLTGTTYLYIVGAPNYGFVYETLAKNFAGELASFETEEEMYFVTGYLSTYDYILTGAKAKDNTIYWTNGDIVGNHISVAEPINNNYLSFSRRNGAVQFYAIDKGFNGAIVEIPGSIYVNQILLEKSIVSIDKNSKYQINPIINPTSLNLSDLIYVSSDEGIATVDQNGLVTPQSIGNATIYVYSKDYQVSNQLSVNVTEKISLESIEITNTNKQISINERIQLLANLKPTSTTEIFLTYSVLDETVASVDLSGFIKGLKEGKTLVRVSNKDGSIYDEIEITVVNPVSSFGFVESIYVTTLEQTNDDIMPLITPVDATNQNIIWESSNPEVAYVENNQLIKLKEGTTTLLATLENTDFKAELVVSINSDYSSGQILKVLQNDNYFLALHSDGSIYYWGGNVLSPKKVIVPNTSTIKDFGIIHDRLFIVTENRKVESYYMGSEPTYLYADNYYNTTNLSRIVKVESNQSSLFALDENGVVWALGNNGYGQLGDGTKIDKQTPIQVQISEVKDIFVSNGLGVFLKKDNSVYFSGGDNTQYLMPQKIQNNVKSVVVTNNQTVTLQTTTDSYSYVYGKQNRVLDSKYTFTDNYSYSNKGYIEDGVVYISGRNTNGKFGIGVSADHTYEDQPMLKVQNAKKVFVFEDNIFVQTTDNKFYGSGLNTNYQLGNLTNKNSNIPVQIFFGLKGNNDGMAIENVNLENLHLYENSLTIDFKEALVSSSQYGYISLSNSANQQLSVAKQFHLDKFSIKPYMGWAVGETYTLTIPSNAFTSKFMVQNEYISYTFTYLGEQVGISLEQQSILDNHKFDTNKVEIDLDFSFASKSAEFDSISIVDVLTNLPVSFETELINNKLKITGLLGFGSYKLLIPQDALKDNMGGSNEAIEISFEVVETLKLLSTTHENKSTRKMVDSPIVLTFNVATEGTNFTGIQLLNSLGIQVDSLISLVDNTLTITPSVNLGQDATYKVLIPEGALMDDLGNINQLIDHSFTTYAPLTFERSSIVNNETNVALNQTIKFYFNHIELSSAYGLIKLTDEQGQNVPFEKTMTNQILSIRPSIVLSEGTYEVTIPAGSFKDELGVENELITLSFETIEKQDRFYWNKTNAFNKWKSFAEKGLYSTFSGNAILNNFNLTNVEQWLRIQATTSESYSTITGVANNYWGTIDPVMVERQILDFDDFQSLLNLVTGDILLEAPEHTFPFVTNVELFNALGEKVSTVGNELITVRVHFNRDMNTNIDLTVKFGSSLPYGERQISGHYVSARVWEGTYQLTTVIENGNQFFFIDNGQAETDAFFKLMPDYGRFGFEIDTTAAQALTMQAESTNTGISLSWEQDDFDTLAGYNIYRSTNEFGYYQKLNRSVVPFTTKTFFDETVEPGVVYFYNFTVVKTDLTESEPSGKVSIRSFDSMAPNIYHTPIYQAFTNNNLIVSASIIDNLVITSAKVFYRVAGETSWLTISMSNRNDKYSAVILSEYITLSNLEYYIEVFDGINYSYKGSSSSPILVEVKQSIDASRLGDVNGDGVISTLDALMMLQAMNSRLNLSSEEFLRADLNQNGILEAAEVLRVLQYISGKVKVIS